MTALETKASRRAFLKGAGAAGLGLVVGFHFDPRSVAGRAVAASAADEFVPNAFIRITPDNKVTILCKHIEFGQGPFTGFATIIADELDASRDQITVEHAPADASKYANLFFQVQGNILFSDNVALDEGNTGTADMTQYSSTPTSWASSSPGETWEPRLTDRVRICASRFA